MIPIPGIYLNLFLGIYLNLFLGIYLNLFLGIYLKLFLGGYEDDVDNGEEFLYTGSGGRDLGKWKFKVRCLKKSKHK